MLACALNHTRAPFQEQPHSTVYAHSVLAQKARSTFAGLLCKCSCGACMPFKSGWEGGRGLDVYGNFRTWIEEFQAG